MIYANFAAIVFLALILIVSLIMFGNELYYRRRISVLGIITFVGGVYLMWYMHTFNQEILSCLETLSNYQIVKPHLFSW